MRVAMARASSSLVCWSALVTIDARGRSIAKKSARLSAIALAASLWGPTCQEDEVPSDELGDQEVMHCDEDERAWWEDEWDQRLSVCDLWGSWEIESDGESVAECETPND